MAGGIKTVTLYRCPSHQFANNQFKMGGSTVWSSYAVSNVPNVKVTGDDIQTITLPYSADYESINALGIDSKIYDILEVKASTLANASVDVTIALNPISSFITTSTTLSGYWDRTPTAVNKGVHIDVADDAMKTSRISEFPSIGEGSGYTLGYAQISLRQNLTGSEVAESYGSFVKFTPTVLTNLYSYLDSVPAHGDKYFLTLQFIINSLTDATTISPDIITDISFSRRCPFRWRITDGDYYLMNTSGANRNPTSLTGDYANYCWYKTSFTNTAASLDYNTPVTITLSNFERYCGRVYIVDDLGNEVCEVPTQLFDSNNQLTFYSYPYSDISGLCTIIKFLDKAIVIPEQHLPWIGDSWAEYTARTLDYDRQMMTDNIRFINEQKNLDLINSLSSGIMNTAFATGMGAMASSAGGGLNTGGLALGAAGGIASTALNAYSTAEQAKKDIRQLKANQVAKEGLMKKAVTNYYQTGYGLERLFRNLMLKPAHIRIDMPANISSTDFDNYIAYKGYPANVYHSATATTGYYKGLLATEFNTANAPQLDQMRRDFANGVRLV